MIIIASPYVISCNLIVTLYLAMVLLGWMMDGVNHWETKWIFLHPEVCA